MHDLIKMYKTKPVTNVLASVVHRYELIDSSPGSLSVYNIERVHAVAFLPQSLEL